jgi:hypothetical protein
VFHNIDCVSSQDYICICCIFACLAEAGKSSKENDGATRSETRNGRALSLSDILYHSEANSEASHDGPGSDREDSDYDEELELDYETSVSGDEGRDVEPNILHGSLNLRIHRKGDSARDSSCTNGSCGSPSSSQNDRTPYQVSMILNSDIVCSYVLLIKIFILFEILGFLSCMLLFGKNHHYLKVYLVKVGWVSPRMRSKVGKY